MILFSSCNLAYVYLYFFPPTFSPFFLSLSQFFSISAPSPICYLSLHKCMQYTHQSPKYLLGLRAISNTASTAMLCNFNYIEKGKIFLFSSKIENRIFSDLIKTRLKNNSIRKNSNTNFKSIRYEIYPSSILSLFSFFFFLFSPLCSSFLE